MLKNKGKRDARDESDDELLIQVHKKKGCLWTKTASEEEDNEEEEVEEVEEVEDDADSISSTSSVAMAKIDT